MQISSNQLPIEEFEAYKQIRFARITHVGNGVYAIQKVKSDINLEALKEIQRLLLSGDVWIVKGKTELAGVGMERKNINQILKEKSVDGEIVYKDITDKKRVRELSKEEAAEVSEIIEHAIEALNKHNNTSNNPFMNTNSQRLAGNKRIFSKIDEPITESQDPHLVNQKRKTQSSSNSPVSIIKNKKKKRRKEKEFREDLNKETDISRIESKKWDIKQEQNRNRNG